jgi:hypothetical protein
VIAGLDPAIHLVEAAVGHVGWMRGSSPRMTNEGTFVDVAEIKKLDSYLKRLFGSPRIRVVPRPQRDDYAEVMLGEEPFGRLLVDDEDDERSYNFEKSIQLPDAKITKLDNETVAKLNLYLKKQIGEKWSVHKRPTKSDSADLHIGDEFVGVLFADDGGVALEMAILEQDLEPEL